MYPLKTFLSNSGYSWISDCPGLVWREINLRFHHWTLEITLATHYYSRGGKVSRSVVAKENHTWKITGN